MILTGTATSALALASALLLQDGTRTATSQLARVDGDRPPPHEHPEIDHLASLFGRSVCAAGDLDDDGVEDYAVGAANASNGEDMPGAVVFFSGRTHDVIRVVWGPASEALGHLGWFGWQIDNVGDVDDDGRAEFLVVGHSGHLWLLSGADGGVLWTRPPPLGVAPLYEGTVPDKNGDGRPEFFLRDAHQHAFVGWGGSTTRRTGEPMRLVRFSRQPVVALPPLASTGQPSRVTLRTLEGGDHVAHLFLPPALDDQALDSLTFTAADVDGDRVDDWIVGAPAWDVVETDDTHDLTGGVFVFSGRRHRLLYSLSPYDRAPGSLNHEFGRAVTPLADVDGDGGLDFALGAPDDTSSGVYLISGKTGTPVWVWHAPDSWEVGTNVDVLPDRNEDGVPELLVGGGDDEFHGAFFASGSVHILSGADGSPLHVIYEHDLPVIRQGTLEHPADD